MDFHSIQFYLRHFSLKHLFSWYSLHRLLLIVEQINKHTEFHWIKVYPMGLYAAIFSISLSLFRIFLLLLLLMLNALLSNIWWFCLIIQLYLWSFYHLLNCEKCYQYSVIPKMADANGCMWFVFFCIGHEVNMIFWVIQFDVSKVQMWNSCHLIVYIFKLITSVYMWRVYG